MELIVDNPKLPTYLSPMPLIRGAIEAIYARKRGHWNECPGAILARTYSGLNTGFAEGVLTENYYREDDLKDE